MLKLLSSIKNSRYMQYIAVLSASLMASCSFMIGSWTSPAVSKLQSNDSPTGFILTTTQVSWIGSSPLLGFMVGGITTPFFLNMIGPKRSLLLSSLPLIVSWLTIAFSKSATLLIIMRFISGVGDGINFVVAPLYIGEIADKDIRGKLATTFPIMASMGNLFVYAVGPFVSYMVLTLCCSVVPIVFALIFFFQPESPYFLVRNGKIEESKHCLRTLLPKNISEAIIDDRLQEIKLTVASKLKNKFELRYILSQKNFRTSIFLGLSLKTISAFSGVTAIRSYLQTIIESTGSSISPKMSSLIFGLVQLPSVLLAAFLVDKFGRRPLLIISTSVCALCLLGEGTYFYLQDVLHENLSGVSWLPTVCLAIYLIMLAIGIVPINGVLMTELHADDIKSTAAGICTTFSGTLTFLLTNYFLPISEAWGMYTMFWMFTVVCFLGSLFGLFILPETKGKSFLEIQEILKTNSLC